MPIPPFTAIFLPILKVLGDGQTWSAKDLTERLADSFSLSAQERQSLLASGQKTVFANRVGWARSHLKHAGLLEVPSWGKSTITDEGKKVLASNPPKIDLAYLDRYPAHLEFRRKRPQPAGAQEAKPDDAKPDESKTPEEQLEQGYQTLRDALAQDLLEKVQSCSPGFFEHLVVKLLVAMGYGGSLTDAGQAVGRSGDEGIDGIIKEDKLGLDVVCIQAKRWKNSVGRPMVQAFAGSMEGYRARKGVLITTATFSSDAREYINKIERKIVLIDGPTLASYMIDYNIGVSTAQTYVLKKLDSDFFAEEQ